MRIFLGTQNIYFIRIESASIGNILKRLQKKKLRKDCKSHDCETDIKLYT